MTAMEVVQEALEDIRALDLEELTPAHMHKVRKVELKLQAAQQLQVLESQEKK